MQLADDAIVDAGAGTQLDFDNAVYLDGHTLTLAGSGIVNINNTLVTGEGGSVISLGGLGGSGTIFGDLTSTGTLAVTLGQLSGVAGLSVVGTANLAGTIDLLLPEGTLVEAGNSFTVLSATDIVNHRLQLAPEDSRNFRLIVGDSQIVVQSIVPEPSGGMTLAVLLTCLVHFRRFKPGHRHSKHFA